MNTQILMLIKECSNGPRIYRAINLTGGARFFGLSKSWRGWVLGGDYMEVRVTLAPDDSPIGDYVRGNEILSDESAAIIMLENAVDIALEPSHVVPPIPSFLSDQRMRRPCKHRIRVSFQSSSISDTAFYRAAQSVIKPAGNTLHMLRELQAQTGLPSQHTLSVATVQTSVTATPSVLAAGMYIPAEYESIPCVLSLSAKHSDNLYEADVYLSDWMDTVSMGTKFTQTAWWESKGRREIITDTLAIVERPSLEPQVLF
jgi:hypothetical protein